MRLLGQVVAPSLARAVTWWRRRTPAGHLREWAPSSQDMIPKPALFVSGAYRLAARWLLISSAGTRGRITIVVAVALIATIFFVLPAHASGAEGEG